MRYLFIVVMLLFAMTATKVAAQGCGGAPSDEGLKVFGFLQAQYESHYTDP
jgi:hypothetical protein